jgi:hypothetical protein
MHPASHHSARCLSRIVFAGLCLVTVPTIEVLLVSYLHRCRQDTISHLGRSVKLVLAFASTVIPVFGLLEVHDQGFYSLSQSQSYVTTDRQSASLSWCEAPIAAQD